MADYKIVDVEQLESGLTATADAIRAKTGGTELLSFPDGMVKAISGLDFDSSFFDTYQDYGKRLNYSNAFAGVGWTNDLFKPKYDMRPNNAYMMFRASNLRGDLVAVLEALGVELDISAAVNTQYMFMSCTSITRIGTLDFRGSENSAPLECTFNQCGKLVTIDKIYLKTGRIGEFNATFVGCYALENVSFNGEIANNGLDMQWSTKLSKASILSILNALSTTTTGLTVTLSLTAVDNAFETSEGVADGSISEEWTTLIATKPNWTIALV